MKAIDYLTSLIAGQKMGSSIPVQVCELEMLKTYLEIQQTMAEGRAALVNALAQQGEPVAWIKPEFLEDENITESHVTMVYLEGFTPLYTAAQAQPAQGNS